MVVCPGAGWRPSHCMSRVEKLELSIKYYGCIRLSMYGVPMVWSIVYGEEEVGVGVLRCFLFSQSTHLH